jgi:2'-5' RNA ligase
MRLFIALDLDDTIREKIVLFMNGIRAFAPDARWLRPESLHVTLKFVGQWPDGELEKVQLALQTIRADAFEIGFRVGIHAGPQLAALAAAVDARMASLDVPREEHAFSPHLTLARRAGGSGSPQKGKGDRPTPAFAKLQEKLAAMSMLDFGTMTSRQFFLYQSELSPQGSRYTKLSSFPLT